MKSLLSYARILVVLGVVLLALPAGASATQPEEVVFTLELLFTGPDSAVGSFVAEGAISDAGQVYEVFRLTDEGSLQGVMVLEGSDGTITLRFNLTIIPTGPTTARTEGHYVIKSGTSAYENIHGVGTGGADVDFVAGTIDAVFSGTVHIDP